MVRRGSPLKQLFGGPGPATSPYKPFDKTQKEEILKLQRHECARGECTSRLNLDMAYFAYKVPPSRGGQTIVDNCEALCPHHFAEKTRFDRE